jgi:hypothetical protein
VPECPAGSINSLRLHVCSQLHQHRHPLHVHLSPACSTPRVEPPRLLAAPRPSPRSASPPGAWSHALTSDQFNIWTPRLLVWSGGGLLIGHFPTHLLPPGAFDGPEVEHGAHFLILPLWSPNGARTRYTHLDPGDVHTTPHTRTTLSRAGEQPTQLTQPCNCTVVHHYRYTHVHHFRYEHGDDSTPLAPR